MTIVFGPSEYVCGVETAVAVAVAMVIIVVSVLNKQCVQPKSFSPVQTRPFTQQILYKHLCLALNGYEIILITNIGYFSWLALLSMAEIRYLGTQTTAQHHLLMKMNTLQVDTQFTKYFNKSLMKM